MRIRRWLSRAALASLMMTFGGALLRAQQAPAGFEPVPKGELGQEILPATPLVFIAYAFVWVALIVYVISLVRRIGRVEQELGDLRAKLGTGKRG